jgi:hypothetical protein
VGGLCVDHYREALELAKRSAEPQRTAALAALEDGSALDRKKILEQMGAKWEKAEKRRWAKKPKIFR